MINRVKYPFHNRDVVKLIGNHKISHIDIMIEMVSDSIGKEIKYFKDKRQLHKIIKKSYGGLYNNECSRLATFILRDNLTFKEALYKLIGNSQKLKLRLGLIDKII